MKKSITVLFLLLSLTLSAQQTNNKALEAVLERVSDTLAGSNGQWEFLVSQRLMICITDEAHNRMRIITPVADVDQLSETELLNSLVANFHTALDVKYAISDEVMWVVFIHPLAELTQEQIEDAITQLFYAAETFGTTYSSTTLSFPGNTKKQQRDNPQKKPGKLQKG